MPTGYTAQLESMGYNVKKWLKEGAIRAMGVCVILRDDGALTEEQIRERLRKDQGDSYHEKKLREARAELEAARSRTPGEWESLYAKERADAQADYDRRLVEFNTKKEKHLAAINEVEALRKRATAQQYAQEGATVGTLKFASDQLHQAFEFDYGSGPYRSDVLDQDLATFRDKRVAKLVWDVEYHTKERARETSREFDRAGAYDEFTAFVDRETK